jgi:hypothetical protein
MDKGKIKQPTQNIEIYRVIKGSLVWLKRVCGKDGCRCYQGKKHVSLYLSRSVKGRTTMTYIPHRYENAVKEAVAEYKKTLKTLDGLSQANLKAIKKRRDI